MSEFAIKDSGKRQEFTSGMVRDTEDSKTDYTTIFNGPMADRWATHLTKGAVKYPNDKDGSPNWMKAAGDAELQRYRRSAIRHMRQWLRGDQDEDHAAAVLFNINGYEYVKGRMAQGQSIAGPGMCVVVNGEKTDPADEVQRIMRELRERQAEQNKRFPPERRKRYEDEVLCGDRP